MQDLLQDGWGSAGGARPAARTKNPRAVFHREHAGVILAEIVVAESQESSAESQEALEARSGRAPQACKICATCQRESFMSDAIHDLLQRAPRARREGRLDDALHLYEEAVALCRLDNDPLQLAHTVRHLGDVHHDAGRLDRAEHCYREALAWYRAHPNTPPLDLANTLRPLAILEERLGRTARPWHSGPKREACTGGRRFKTV